MLQTRISARSSCHTGAIENSKNSLADDTLNRNAIAKLHSDCYASWEIEGQISQAQIEG